MSTPPPAPPPRQSQSFLNRYRFPLVCAGLGVCLVVALIVIFAKSSRLASLASALTETQQVADNYARQIEAQNELIETITEGLTKAEARNSELQDEAARLARELEQQRSIVTTLIAELEKLKSQEPLSKEDTSDQEKRYAEAVMRVQMEITKLQEGFDDKYKLAVKKVDRSEPGLDPALHRDKWSYDERVLSAASDAHRRAFFMLREFGRAYANVDLVGTPKDYREVHNQYTLSLEKLLRESLGQIQDEEFKQLVALRMIEPPPPIAEEYRKKRQQYLELVDKYRVIAGDKPK